MREKPVRNPGAVPDDRSPAHGWENQARAKIREMFKGITMGENDALKYGSYKVLVVDDDERLLALARLSLSRIGVEVETAATSADALETFGDLKPDLLILDVVMPDLSGWEVLRRIRESSDVAVMLLSGRDSDVDKARGLDLGADDYLTKPFSFLEFEARVRALLRRSRPGASEGFS